MNRTPPTELKILSLLKAQEGLHGLRIARESEGALKKGTVYTTLQRMVKKGLVRSEREVKKEFTSGIPRRFYFLTEKGRQVLESCPIVQDRSKHGNHT